MFPVRAEDQVIKIEQLVYHRGQDYRLELSRVIYSEKDEPFLVWRLYTLDGELICKRTNTGTSYVPRPKNKRVAQFGSETTEKFRNQGFGYLVLQKAIDYLKLEGWYDEIHLATKEFNIPCQKMVTKANFKEVFSIRPYFKNYRMKLD